jgi:hypothetical protein
MEMMMSNQDQAPKPNQLKPDTELPEERKRSEMERVQEEAAEEREETGGYQ